jgi:hypothetical protein
MPAPPTSGPSEATIGGSDSGSCRIVKLIWQISPAAASRAWRRFSALGYELIEFGLVFGHAQMFNKFMEFALLAFQTSKRLRSIFVERRGSIHSRAIPVFAVVRGGTLERRT